MVYKDSIKYKKLGYIELRSSATMSDICIKPFVKMKKRTAVAAPLSVYPKYAGL